MRYISFQKNTTSISELPSEACLFNGVYLEELVKGYSTLTTRGRNTLEVTQHLSGEIIGRDGEIDFGSNIPSRSIEVTYMLRADTPENLVVSFDIIKNYLRNQGQLEMVFNDDPDYRFYGRLTGITEPTEGTLFVKGTMTFNCLDPYKYSVPKTFNGGTLADTSLMDYQVKIEKIEVTLSGSASLVKITNSTTGETISITGSFISGDKVTFDFLQTKIFKGLLNITKDLAWESSSFPDMRIKNGDNIVVSPSTATTVITYRGKRL